VKLNISHNYLNGVLSSFAGELSSTVEVLNFDVNQLTGSAMKDVWPLN